MCRWHYLVSLSIIVTDPREADLVLTYFSVMNFVGHEYPKGRVSRSAGEHAENEEEENGSDSSSA